MICAIGGAVAEAYLAKAKTFCAQMLYPEVGL